MAEAAAIDDVGPALHDRLQQCAKILRVVLQIRILHDDRVAGAFLKAGLQRASLPLVALVQHDFQVAVRSIGAVAQSGQVLARSIAAAVIDNHNLQRQLRRSQAVDYFGERADLVIDRHHH
jgi:hypothetical protein